MRLSIIRSKIYFLRIVEECPSSLLINLTIILSPTNWVTLARFSAVLTTVFSENYMWSGTTVMEFYFKISKIKDSAFCVLESMGL